MSNNKQLISKDIKFDPNATPWQWTDNEDQVIERGAQVRVKLLGIRSDVGAMYAIGSIKEDYLGQVDANLLSSSYTDCFQRSTCLECMIIRISTRKYIFAKKRAPKFKFDRGGGS